MRAPEVQIQQNTVDSKEPVSQFDSLADITHNQFKIKIEDLLSNLQYPSLSTILDNISFLEDINKANNLRKITIKCLKQHLTNIYDFNSQILQGKESSFELDSFIQMVSKSLCGQVDFQQDSQLLYSLLKKAVNEDKKYAFIIFRSNSLIFRNEKQQLRQNAASQNIRHLKYLNNLTHFLQLIISSKQQHFFNDFLQLLRSPKNIFEDSHENRHLIEKQHLQTEKCSIKELYLIFCMKIINQCNRVYQSSEEKLDIAEKALRVIEQSISFGIYFYENQKKSLLLEQLSNTHSLFNLPANRLFYEFYPTIMILHLVKNENQVSLLSHKEYLYFLYVLFLRISPKNTLQSQLGTFMDAISSFIVELLSLLCKILIMFNEKMEGLIEGEKIWIDSKCFVDLIPLYFRINIYSGFINKESQECSMLIRKIMGLSSSRYRKCPLMPIRIWTEILGKSMPHEYNFRIHCITNIKKQLFSFKSVFLSKKEDFQFHKYHSHCYIFIVVGQSIGEQIQITLKSENNRFHIDFCGHVISYISNWLLCLKFWANGSGKDADQLRRMKINEEIEKVKKKYENLKIRVEELSQQMKKMQSSNKEGASEYQLLLFQLKGIKFD